jgi:hypothetical protein
MSARRRPGENALLEATVGGRSRKPRSFEEWMLQTSASGIARTFLVPYTLAVWAHPRREMCAQWMGERVVVLTRETFLERVCPDRDFAVSLPTSFR